MGLFNKRKASTLSTTELNSIRVIDNNTNNYVNRHVSTTQPTKPDTTVSTHTATAHISDIGQLYKSKSQLAQHGYVVQHNPIDNNDDIYTQQRKLQCQKLYIKHAPDTLKPNENFLFVRPSHIQPKLQNNFEQVLHSAEQHTTDDTMEEKQAEPIDIDEYYGGTVQQQPAVAYTIVPMTTAQALKALTQTTVDTDETIDEENESEVESDVSSDSDDSTSEPLHCGVCQKDDIIDPWISPCEHICCSECWVTYLSNANNLCPVCNIDIDVEQLKSVILCAICGDKCVQPYTAVCSHTACNECWQEELAVKPTCPVCDTPVDPNDVK